MFDAPLIPCRLLHNGNAIAKATLPQAHRVCGRCDQNLRQLPILQPQRHALLSVCWGAGSFLCTEAQRIQSEQVRVGEPNYTPWKKITHTHTPGGFFSSLFLIVCPLTSLTLVFVSSFLFLLFLMILLMVWTCFSSISAVTVFGGRRRSSFRLVLQHIITVVRPTSQ